MLEIRLQKSFDGFRLDTTFTVDDRLVVLGLNQAEQFLQYDKARDSYSSVQHDTDLEHLATALEAILAGEGTPLPPLTGR